MTCSDPTARRYCVVSLLLLLSSRWLFSFALGADEVRFHAPLPSLKESHCDHVLYHSRSNHCLASSNATQRLATMPLTPHPPHTCSERRTVRASATHERGHRRHAWLLPRRMRFFSTQQQRTARSMALQTLQLYNSRALMPQGQHGHCWLHQNRSVEHARLQR
jgi:hypothetical protein